MSAIEAQFGITHQEMTPTDEDQDRSNPVETTVERLYIRSSAKTRMIEAMEEEREGQQRALEQIEDCDEETRSWWAGFSVYSKTQIKSMQLLTTMIALNVPSISAKLVSADSTLTGARLMDR